MYGSMCATMKMRMIFAKYLYKTWNAIGQFQRKFYIYTWLYRIASNEAITFINKQKINTTAIEQSVVMHRGATDGLGCRVMAQKIATAI